MLENKKYYILADNSLHNVGDFLIYESIKKIIHPEADIKIIKPSKQFTDEQFGCINNSDGLIIAGSNLYRRDNFPNLSLGQIKRINVPVIPIGVGAQAPSDKDLYKIDKKPLNAIKEIHKKCKTGSVRDLHTYLTLKKNGIHNILLTGCPVLFHSLKLPKINSQNKNLYELFVPQFYKFNNFTLFKKSPKNKIQKLPRKILRPLENCINNAAIKHTLNKNNKLLLLVQQNRDKERIIKWNMEKRLIKWNGSEDYKNTILKSSYLHTFRLHAGMFALSYGIPASFYGFDSRIQSFCKMLNIKYFNLFDLLNLPNTEYIANFYYGRHLLAKKMLIFFELNNIPINNDFKNEVTGYNL